MDLILEKINLPATFRLPDVPEFTAPVFAFRFNPYADAAIENVRPWYEEFSKQHAELFQMVNFTLDDLRFYIGALYSDASQERLEVVLRWNILSFIFDDLSDSGSYLTNPEGIKAQVIDFKNGILFKPDATRPKNPFAAANHDIYQAFRDKSRPGTFRRLAAGATIWLDNMLKQSYVRAGRQAPSSEEYLSRRRGTAAGYMCWATVEYAADIDLPDEVFTHPAVTDLLDVLVDIGSIQNDIVSWNVSNITHRITDHSAYSHALRHLQQKEQAAGDGQNLVTIMMVEKQAELQEAIELATIMLSEYVARYRVLRDAVPSFGAANDIQLKKYIDAITSSLQGIVVWYHMTPRYTLDLDLSKRGEMIIPVFKRRQL